METSAETLSNSKAPGTKFIVRFTRFLVYRSNDTNQIQCYHNEYNIIHILQYCNMYNMRYSTNIIVKLYIIKEIDCLLESEMHSAI